MLDVAVRDTSAKLLVAQDVSLVFLILRKFIGARNLGLGDSYRWSRRSIWPKSTRIRETAAKPGFSRASGFPKTKAGWRLLGALTNWSRSLDFQDQKLRMLRFARGSLQFKANSILFSATLRRLRRIRPRPRSSPVTLPTYSNP